MPVFAGIKAQAVSAGIKAQAPNSLISTRIRVGFLGTSGLAQQFDGKEFFFFFGWGGGVIVNPVSTAAKNNKEIPNGEIQISHDILIHAPSVTNSESYKVLGTHNRMGPILFRNTAAPTILGNQQFILVVHPF